MRTLLALIPLTMLITACATGGSESVCPQIVEYDKAAQTQAADELQALPAGGVIRSRFMPDYGRMRAEVRVCRKSK